jgi:hypothetical protein
MDPVRGCRTACIPLALALGACAEPPGGPPAAVTAPTVVSVDQAAIELAMSRCDHDNTCSDVGTGRRYASVAECTAQVQQSSRQDLARCSTGIEPGRLAACERRLRGESCRPLSTLTRMLACRPQALCAGPPSPDQEQPSFTSEDVYGMYSPPTRESPRQG